MQKATRMRFLSVGDIDSNFLMPLSRQTWLQLAYALSYKMSRTIHRETMLYAVNAVAPDPAFHRQR